MLSDRASQRASSGNHRAEDRHISNSGSATRDFPAFEGAGRQPIRAGPDRVPIRDEAKREPVADASRREEIISKSSQAKNHPSVAERQDSKGRSVRGTPVGPGSARERIPASSSKRGGTPAFDGHARLEIASKLSGRGTPAFDGPGREAINSGVSGRGSRSEGPKHSTQTHGSVHSAPHAPSVRIDPQLPKRRDSQSAKASEHGLISYRLRQAYGYQISDLEIKHICRMDSRNGEKEVELAGMKYSWTAESKGVTKNVVLGRDVKAVSGQVSGWRLCLSACMW